MRKKKYIHVSFDVVEEFIPRVPKSRLENEDSEIQRICVTDNIDHCLHAMVAAGRTLELMQQVNVPCIIHAYYLDCEDIWETKRVSKYVPDAKENHESWLLSKSTRIYRVDYEIQDIMIHHCADDSDPRNAILASYQLKRTHFQDNSTLLAKRFHVTDSETFSKLIKEHGYVIVMCDMGPDLIRLLENKEKKDKIL